MSLPHVILGLLQQQEQTGYDLKISCFDKTLAHLWSADQAQIYRTLDKLEAQGWVTCSVEIQHDRPNRKVYGLTAAGCAELVRWLQCHQPSPTVREPLLIQLFHGAQLPNEAIVQLLEQQWIDHQEKLAACEKIQLPPLEDGSASRDQVMQRLVLEWVMQKEQAYMAWLKQAIEVVRGLKESA